MGICCAVARAEQQRRVRNETHTVWCGSGAPITSGWGGIFTIAYKEKDCQRLSLLRCSRQACQRSVRGTPWACWALNPIPKTTNTMSTKSTIAIALTALAAGAAIGLLLAPASGAETRKKLAKKGSDLKDRLADMLDEGGELIEKLKGDAKDLADKAKDTANTTKDRVKDAASEAASSARSTANGGYKS